jgi:hypothetical protein
MEHTLVLNATFEPINIVPWKRALSLLCQGKVEVLAEYDREVHSISFTIKMPSVLRLLKYVKIRKRLQHVKFCRANIYARDHHTCQYCGRKCSTEDLTFDHVIPIVKDGGKTWDELPRKRECTLSAAPKSPNGCPQCCMSLSASGVRLNPGGTTSTGMWSSRASPDPPHTTADYRSTSN